MSASSIKQNSFPRLLSPIKVGSQTLRNRIVMGSMHTRLEYGQDAVTKLADFFAERARGIKDLGDGEWRDYVCVEPGRVSDDTAAAGELAPGEEFTLRQTLTVGDVAAAL